MLLVSLLAFAALQSNQPDAVTELFVRTTPSTRIESLASAVAPFGRIDCRARMSHDYLVQLKPCVDRESAKRALDRVPGAKVLSPGEEPVDFRSLPSMERKLRHLRQDGQEPDGKAESGADYLESYYWFCRKRAKADGTMDWRYLGDGRVHAMAMPAMHIRQPADGSPLPLASQSWRFVGPTNLTAIDPNAAYFGLGAANGRVNTVAFDPKVSSTIYAGAAHGGPWKSVDSGTTWTWLSHLNVPFLVTHFSVNAPAVPQIVATCGSSVVNAGIHIDPFKITEMALNPSSVQGGATSAGSVTLNAKPGDKLGAITVALSSDNPAVTVPATVSVTPHTSTAAFLASSSVVSTQATATLTATLGSSSKSTQLTVTAAGLANFTITPSTVKVSSGSPVTGTVTLGSPAPAGGALIVLSSSLPPLATVPLSVTIPQGQTTANFAVSYASTTTIQANVTITAGYAGQQLTATLTLKP